LEDGTILAEFSAGGRQIWAVDYTSTRLFIFIDSLSQSTTPVSPVNQSAGLDNTSLNLKWQPLSGATQYEWQVSDNTAFTGILAALTGTSDASSAHLTGLDPAAVYYWRVRATKPYLSPWSEASSFTTIIGGSNITSILIVPAAGATTAVKPVFQWSSVISADSYDFQVANNIDFKNPVIDKTGDNALPGNAWESENCAGKRADLFLESKSPLRYQFRSLVPDWCICHGESSGHHRKRSGTGFNDPHNDNSTRATSASGIDDCHAANDK
jgi:hypothetical protein